MARIATAHTRRHRLILVVISVMTTMAVLTTPALPSGATESNGRPEGYFSPGEQSSTWLAEDARLIAENSDWAFDEAVDLLVFQQQVRTYLNEMPEDVFVSSFAGAEFHNDTTPPSATIHFAGDVPLAERLRATVALGHNLARATLAADRELTLTEQMERREAVSNALRQQGYDIVNSQASSDGNGVIAEVVAAAGTTQRRATTGPSEARRRPDLEASAAARAGAPQNEVSVTEVPGSLEDYFVDTSALGGQTLTKYGYSPGTVECTSGFAVRNGSGVEGIATVAHCDNIWWHDNYNANGTWKDRGRTYNQAEYSGYWGEFEWHTTAHNDLPDFFSGNATVRPVESVKYRWAFSAGEYMCHYGRVTGYSCGVVRGYAELGSHKHVILVAHDRSRWPAGLKSAGGDSGGPWFAGTEAMGFHKGHYLESGDNVLIPADMINEGLGNGIWLQTR